jgi:hypothetical protein
MRLLTGSRVRQVADAVIRDPPRHTSFDEHGAVRSVQAADLTMPVAALDGIWSPMHLERLARTYWKYLSRVTLGLIRVDYTPTERYLVLIARPFVLLRFRAPEYSMDGSRGIVRWRIRDGILVASEGHEGDGFLEIDVRRGPAQEPGRATLHVEVEIAYFYPAIAFRIARWVYANTQSRIHVLVTHGFLRSLEDLELERSAVGRFDPEEPAPSHVNVGDTPWPLVGALALGSAAMAAALLRSRRRLSRRRSR